MKSGVVSIFFCLLLSEILVVFGNHVDNELAALVDVGEPKTRSHRGVDELDAVENDIISQNSQQTPELIQNAKTRKSRGNGADSEDIVAEAIKGTIADIENVEKEKGLREEGISAADEATLQAKTNAKRSQTIEKECKQDEESCEENANCCSGFCSWTKNFTCVTVI